MISSQDFGKINIPAGTIVEIDDFPKARKPAYKLKIDFGKSVLNNHRCKLQNIIPKEQQIGHTKLHHPLSFFSVKPLFYLTFTFCYYLFSASAI